MIEVSEQNGVAILRLMHGKANAMTTDLCAALTLRFEDLEATTARAVVITGQGRIFSAGVDLVRLLDGGIDYVQAFLPALGTMFETVYRFPKPVVAAVNGHAMAGGCVLAAAADRRLMARDGGRIGVTEILVGVPFPPIALEIMRGCVAPQHFVEAVIGGATYEPAEAVRRGLVDEVVDPGALLERAVTTATRLADLSPAAFALTKQQIRQPTLDRVEEARDNVAAEVDALWAAPQTLARIRDYAERTLRKG
ncbi:MAG: enoyl-CoA hydratase/isomerase family protein [Hyphomicrobiales bacterium]|nr:enoyl-CoA hydratase/isomerase family protein [Hyphomicrobiales bacterium]